MSRLVVVNFVSLDGVMQSVLSAGEDRDGGFEHGGWVVPYTDDTVAEFMRDATINAGGLLLGRRTYEIFAATWPNADPAEPAVAAMNSMPKYVVSRTLTSATWDRTSVLRGDVSAEAAALKRTPGKEIVVLGSGGLIGALADHDLIDEYRILLFPLVLGAGKRMFDGAGALVRLMLTDVKTSSTGVVLLTYQRP